MSNQRVELATADSKDGKVTALITFGPQGEPTNSAYTNGAGAFTIAAPATLMFFKFHHVIYMIQSCELLTLEEPW